MVKNSRCFAVDLQGQSKNIQYLLMGINLLFRVKKIADQTSFPVKSLPPAQELFARFNYALRNPECMVALLQESYRSFQGVCRVLCQVSPESAAIVQV